ncbi:tRNA-specific 2-thiouridylase MnmA [wastewater metagenome]|uniref:tRNA-specific 2-thiouridylase MnmA n=4 Tax=root TaxID=1 RepID=A0A5B8R9Q1_9ZZZZ|nr:tRNA-specific 2-thiouridylase MnmA [uncultured organism]
MTSERIIVGLSGGVDSAVAALTLLEQGHRVEGLFMKNWEDDDTDTHCTAAEDLADAAQVCDELGIPLHQANFAAAYREEVFAHCLREYRAGRTPNPDILCNQRIKFRAFLDHARRLGADRVATGHYAGIGEANGRHTLLRAADRNKDQSYFLYTLDQERLAAAVFPLAGMTKPDVRERAEAAGFDNFDKKDSTGICFIGERDFRAFLARYIATDPGDIVTPGGEVVGRHQGLAFYTLGQRRGLALGGRAGHGDGAWYVVDKDMTGNRLIVGQGHDHPLLLSTGLRAGELCWVDGEGPAGPLRCTARTRYRQPDQPCRLTPEGDTVRVTFETPQRAVVPGQSAVFYDGERCLGGGIIQERLAGNTPEVVRGVA